MQNIPDALNYKDEIADVLSPISKGIRAVVPVPKETNELTSLYGSIRGLMSSIDVTHRKVQQSRAEYESYVAQAKACEE